MPRPIYWTIAALITFASTARGGAVIAFSQAGNDVLAIGQGTLDTASLTDQGTISAPAAVNPSSGGTRMGIPNPTGDIFGLLPSVTYGTGSLTAASSATGDYFGIYVDGSGTYLVAPTGYSSGSHLSGSATWDNTTISGLGMTPGTYTWNWGSGATADSLEVIIPASVPEPSTAALAVIGAGVIATYIRSRHRRERRRQVSA